MADKESTPHKNRFGTFGGVFTPSILTILGVIFFLRAGFVVGSGGIVGALLILCIAEAIILVTCSSVAALATNTPVKGGGAYYMISRSLGPEFGGAIGIALYLAQVVSIPFYAIGFSEVVTYSFPALQPHFLPLTLSTITVLFLLNWIGTGWTIRTQYFVMLAEGVAIAIILGSAAWRFNWETFTGNLQPFEMSTVGFWALFAIYFPAVTGILAGINMSGDLKNPGRSLVRGTFAAVVTGFVLYLAEILLCGGAQTRAQLIENPYGTLLLHAPGRLPLLIVAGVFASALSSTVSSFMAAPRVLQAFSRDRLLPHLGWFAKGTSQKDEPRNSLFLTWLLAIGITILVAAGGGDNITSRFDFVAQIVTLIFLSTYALINLAAFVEAFSDNPSFRPRYKAYHWFLSLLGALLCFGIMFIIHVGAAIFSAILLLGIGFFIRRQLLSVTFGDARRGFIFSILRRQLRRLVHASASIHPKNWRPIILVLSDEAPIRTHLLRLGLWFEAHRGVLTVAEILTGDLARQLPARNDALTMLAHQLREEHIEAYPEVLVARDLDEGIRCLIQSNSLLPLKPNTILLGWPRNPERIQPFIQHIQDMRLLGKSILCLANADFITSDFFPPPPAAPRRIDIWWRGLQNGSLMLLLAWLLTQDAGWKDTPIRILRAVENEDDREQAIRDLHKLARAARIDVTVAAPVLTDGMAPLLRTHSADASFVFLGFQPPATPHAASVFHQQFSAMLKNLPPTLLISSSGEADFSV